MDNIQLWSGYLSPVISRDFLLILPPRVPWEGCPQGIPLKRFLLKILKKSFYNVYNIYTDFITIYLIGYSVFYMRFSEKCMRFFKNCMRFGKNCMRFWKRPVIYIHWISVSLHLIPSFLPDLSLHFQNKFCSCDF